MFKFNFYHTRKENFFQNKNERETAGLIGHLRGDFGRLGTDFHHTWFEKNKGLKTESFQKEFDEVMGFLRERLLTDRAYMRSFVYANKEMKIDDAGTESYGMFVESESYEYDIRAICDDGNYDFYIFCYDKRFQEPQFLNAKRFRDEHGKLSEDIKDVASKTLTEARAYYVDGDKYEHNGKVYTFKKVENNMLFEGADGEQIFIVPENLGTYLPDVASKGGEFTKLANSQILSELTLGDLLKSTVMSDVHLTHDEIDMDLATIVELKDSMLTDEGRKEWADVLNAKVKQIFDGGYGTQIECSGVSSQRLADFSYALAGLCSVQDSEKWFKEDEEQGMSMSM